MRTLARRVLRRFHENLELGTLLAFVAGLVNTIGFLQFGAFVSHMSGHATRAAVEYAEGNSSASVVYFLELIAFISGALTTAFFLQGHTAAERHVRYTLPVLLESACIIGFLVLNEAQGLFWFNLDHISLTTLVLTFAMGLQNAMLRQASGAIVRTTHMTGIATDIGIEIGAALHAAQTALRKTRDLRATCKVFTQRLGIGRFTFHCFLITAFFLGAVVGTTGYLYVNAQILILPVVILLFIAGREFLRPRPRD